MSGPIRLKIHALAYGGDGVGRNGDGKICFVPGALPGEVVTASLRQEKNSFARLTLCRVETPSPARRTPECPLCTPDGGCPGCAYLHADYPLELSWKQRQFTDFLTRGGLCGPEKLLPPFAAPKRTGYRNKITLHCNADGQWGYFGQDNRTIIPLTRCLLADEAINRAIATLPAAPGSSVTLRCTAKDGVTLIHDGHAPAHRDWLTDELEHWGSFKVPADGFFQINPAVADELVNRVVSAVEKSGCRRLLELYCGVGVFSLAAARKIPEMECTGVELNKSAIPAVRFNARKCGVEKRCRFIAGDAGKALANIPLDGKILLLDPPRTGVSGKVLTIAAASHASAIFYISCGPDTLRRDLQRLKAAGWCVTQAGMLDMFPATAHFESFVILHRE